MSDLPIYLGRALEDAEADIAAAEQRMNGVQRSIALWHCDQGRHVWGMYTQPAIGRACIYCQTRAPEQDPATADVE